MAELSDNYDNNDDNDDDDGIADDRSPSPTQAPKEQLKSSKGSSPTTTKPPNIPPPSKKHSKPGILYLSRIPPYMPPSQSIASPLALRPDHAHLPDPRTPLPAALTASPLPPPRTKNASTSTDGLNSNTGGTPKPARLLSMGMWLAGRRGGWFRDDVWAVRYLKGVWVGGFDGGS